MEDENCAIVNMILALARMQSINPIKLADEIANIEENTKFIEKINKRRTETLEEAKNKK